MSKYLKGAFFLTLSSLTSVVNDILMKKIALGTIDTLFLRFFFATIILLPLILYYKPLFTKKSIAIHSTRALIFGAGMFFFLIALKKLPLSTTTAINFSIPVFVVIFAKLILKEPIAKRLHSVILSMIGIIVIALPQNNKYIILLIISAILFAALDIFNKYLIKEESMLAMLFGSSLGIVLLLSPFYSFDINAIKNNLPELICMGIGANLILYFILKAWQYCDISALQPIKYIEFPISIYFSYAIFQDKTTTAIIIGFSFIFIAFIINFYSETKKKD